MFRLLSPVAILLFALFSTGTCAAEDCDRIFKHGIFNATVADSLQITQTFLVATC